MATSLCLVLREKKKEIKSVFFFFLSMKELLSMFYCNIFCIPTEFLALCKVLGTVYEFYSI